MPVLKDLDGLEVPGDFEIPIMSLHSSSLLGNFYRVWFCFPFSISDFFIRNNFHFFTFMSNWHSAHLLSIISVFLQTCFFLFPSIIY